MNGGIGLRGFHAAARLVRALTWIQLTVAGILFILSLGLYTAEVVMRTGFSTGYPEYYEVVGFAFIYVFLLGAGALYARNEDIMIEAVYQRLGDRAAAWLVLIVYAGMAVTMVMIFIHTWILIQPADEHADTAPRRARIREMVPALVSVRLRHADQPGGDMGMRELGRQRYATPGVDRPPVRYSRP